MTIAAHIEALNRLEADLVKGDLLDNTVVIAGNAMLAEIKNRIFKQGKNTADTQIGNYSTTPIYVEKQMFAKPAAFKPQGKKNFAGNTFGDIIINTQPVKVNKKGKVVKTKQQIFTLVKPNYQERTTMYLENGYKELRDIQSFQTGYVDLKYRGDLMKSYQSQKVAQALLLGFTDELSSKKRQGQEKRFGKIFAPTQKELNQYLAAVTFSIRRLTVNYINANPTVDIS